MLEAKSLDLNSWSRNSATVGAFAWCLTLAASLAGIPGFWLMETLFLLGPLVVVPLGLSLLARTPVRPSRALNVAALTQPFAAILVITSFLFRPGTTAAILVLPWLAVTALYTLAGAARLRHGFSHTEEICFSAALFYLPVGGIWLVLSRLGQNPMGLSDAIVLLTAVHFHFAGFGACCLAGAVGRGALADGPRTYLRYRLPALGVVAGTFLIAIGFLLSPWPKFAAIVLFAWSLLSIAALEFRLVRRLHLPVARALIRISASSLFVGMALAVLYGLGEARFEEWISIPDMARFHGVINSVGFTLCGLAGWTLALANQPAEKPARRACYQPPTQRAAVEVHRAV